jgi:hypothetical protein
LYEKREHLSGKLNLTSYLPELTFKMRREKVGRKGGIEQG